MTTWQSFRFFNGEQWDLVSEFTEADGTPLVASRAMFEFHGLVHQAEFYTDTPTTGVEASLFNTQDVRGARFVFTGPFTREKIPGGLLHYRVWAYRMDGSPSVQAEGLIKAVPTL